MEDFKCVRFNPITPLTNYEKVFNKIVEQLAEYVTNAHLKSMVLGISGGIDSTVCAAICHEVSLKTGVKLIGRSITMTNTPDEISTSLMVGKAFCDDFKEVVIGDLLQDVLDVIKFEEKELEQTPVANGNIQARLRMIYLYNLAGLNKGIVIDTDNKTENALGFFTIMGDQGDYKPIGNLWKTEVYELAQWIMKNKCGVTETAKQQALFTSIGLLPTDGLGISSSDVEQLGAKDYDEVDAIFHEFFKWCKIDVFVTDFSSMVEPFLKIKKGVENYKTYENVLTRYKNNAFKRKRTPVAQVYF